MTIDPVQYARRWKTLAVLSPSLVIIGLDNTILNVALRRCRISSPGPLPAAAGAPASWRRRRSSLVLSVRRVSVRPEDKAGTGPA